MKMMYELDEDAKRGFKEAVRNGQTKLATEYLQRMFDDLERRVETLESTPAPAATNGRKSTKEDVSVES